MNFAIASAVEAAGDLVFRGEIPRGWQQGRGTFGGLVLGSLLRAIERAEPDATRAARTLSGDVCGPLVPGPVTIRVRFLRRGSNQSNVVAELTQNDAVLATAIAVLSPPRKARALGDLRLVEPPPAERWQDVAVVDAAPPLAPEFTVHYEYRSAENILTRSGTAFTEGWVREKSVLAVVDAPALIGRLDAWWPTLFALGAPRPMATISFTAELLVDPKTLAPDVPLRYRARMAALADGFFVELRELWHGDLPVALNQQTFAILA
jgi:hypothetical protein